MAMLQSVKPGAKPDAKPAAGSMTPEALKAKMHLTPEQSAQLDRIVLAGKKVMFSQKTHGMMLEQLDGPGPIAQKIGQGVAGLVALLRQESSGSLPPNLLIPAGMILCAVVAQFLRDAGQDISDQDIAAAIETMTTAVLYASGIDPDKLTRIAGGKQDGGKPTPADGGEPAAQEEAQ